MVQGGDLEHAPGGHVNPNSPFVDFAQSCMLFACRLLRESDADALGEAASEGSSHVPLDSTPAAAVAVTTPQGAKWGVHTIIFLRFIKRVSLYAV